MLSSILIVVCKKRHTNVSRLYKSVDKSVSTDQNGVIAKTLTLPRPPFDDDREIERGKANAKNGEEKNPRERKQMRRTIFIGHVLALNVNGKFTSDDKRTNALNQIVFLFLFENFPPCTSY